jgi:glycerophosphoryl diester phosphodiesterase
LEKQERTAGGKPSRPARRAVTPASVRAEGFLVLAHRGDHRACPANTLEAFSSAIDVGADGIETDVRLSRDGIAVLFHDRVAPNGRAVAQLTLAELERAAGYPVPTLARALELFAAPLWNLEIKTREAVAPTAAILATFEDRRILVTSFWHPAVRDFARAGVDTGLLLASHPQNLAALLAQLPRDRSTSTIVWEYEMLDDELLSGASRAGVRSLAYGPETADEHRRCLALAAHGLAGTITDHLELLLGLRSERESRQRRRQRTKSRRR